MAICKYCGNEFTPEHKRTEYCSKHCYQRDYYSKNSEKIREYYRKYYEKIKEKQKEYYQNNREKCNKKSHDWYMANKDNPEVREKRRAAMRKYQARLRKERKLKDE